MGSAKDDQQEMVKHHGLMTAAIERQEWLASEVGRGGAGNSSGIQRVRSCSTAAGKHSWQEI